MKLIDNRIVFQDVPDNYWAAEAIAFTASRELFLGTEVGMFAPGVSMSRAMLFTVLARLDGVETEGGGSWYSKARDWAMAAGISDGSAPEAAITREQLIALLYRYAGQPAANGGSKSFADSGEVSVWARGAMDWAVETGILNGKPGNLLAPVGVPPGQKCPPCLRVLSRGAATERVIDWIESAKPRSQAACRLAPWFFRTVGAASSCLRFIPQ
ncbi:S-layer homology domain-containing protein [Paenibacillus sp. MY03]|uniref:S-layer homology domain-containing protein n=1 Tax=Paenibacillus sp. MY03 TaxID=302980 RepID=UPI00211B3971|nr:S-layer homology domain-containing protein [Paenibacillus sp. MY03]